MLNPLVRPNTPESELALKAAFDHLLSASCVLPKGGYLGFGLHQEYPLNQDGFGNLIDYLKGSDAIIQNVCRQLSSNTALQIIYRGEDGGEDGDFSDFAMIDHFFDFPRHESVEMLESEMKKDGGIYISKPKPVNSEGGNYWPDRDSRLVWVDLTKYTRTETAYLAHGNEAYLGYAYCTLCLIVHVAPFENRTANIKKNR